MSKGAVTVNVEEVVMQSELSVLVNIRGARAVRLRLAGLRVLAAMMKALWPGRVRIVFSLGAPSEGKPILGRKV